VSARSAPPLRRFLECEMLELARLLAPQALQFAASIVVRRLAAVVHHHDLCTSCSSVKKQTRGGTGNLLDENAQCCGMLRSPHTIAQCCVRGGLWQAIDSAIPVVICEKTGVTPKAKNDRKAALELLYGIPVAIGVTSGLFALTYMPSTRLNRALWMQQQHFSIFRVASGYCKW